MCVNSEQFITPPSSGSCLPCSSDPHSIPSASEATAHHHVLSVLQPQHTSGRKPCKGCLLWAMAPHSLQLLCFSCALTVTITLPDAGLFLTTVASSTFYKHSSAHITSLCRHVPQFLISSKTECSSSGLRHSHGNAGSLIHWTRPGIKHASSWILVGLVNLWATKGTHQNAVLSPALKPSSAVESLHISLVAGVSGLSSSLNYPGNVKIRKLSVQVLLQKVISEFWRRGLDLGITIFWKLLRWLGITYIYTIIYKRDKQQGPTVSHREVHSVFCNNFHGRRIWKRMDICICVAKSLYWTPEINTTLEINYISIFLKKLPRWY